MTMRERLARAMQSEFRKQAYEGFNYANPTDDPDYMGLDGNFDMCKVVDAILAEMETPSEDVIQAGEDDGGHSVYRWSAMIRAIREGK